MFLGKNKACEADLQASMWQQTPTPYEGACSLEDKVIERMSREHVYIPV